MTVVKAISELMDLLHERNCDLEPLLVLTKRIADQDEELEDLKKSVNYWKEQLIRANKQLGKEVVESVKHEN